VGHGILLDLHNLLCNERNGRQTVAKIVPRLPTPPAPIFEFVPQLHCRHRPARDCDMSWSTQ
jgi:hypothetical protein